MIRLKDIKKVLAERVQPGTSLTVRELQDLVRNYGQLTDEDWEPHTETRKTSYPKWKHRLQGVLSDYKKRGLVEHDPETRTYFFPEEEQR